MIILFILQLQSLDIMEEIFQQMVSIDAKEYFAYLTDEDDGSYYDLEPDEWVDGDRIGKAAHFNIFDLDMVYQKILVFT